MKIENIANNYYCWMPPKQFSSTCCKWHLTPPCFQWFQLPAILWAHGRNVSSFQATWPLASYVPWLLKGFVLNCKLHSILMLLHVDSDSCDRSGVGRKFLCEEQSWKTWKVWSPVGTCLKKLISNTEVNNILFLASFKLTFQSTCVFVYEI